MQELGQGLAEAGLHRQADDRDVEVLGCGLGLWPMRGNHDVVRPACTADRRGSGLMRNIEIFLDQHMRIDPAKSKGVNRGAAGNWACCSEVLRQPATGPSWPGFGLANDTEGAAWPGQSGRGGFIVRGRWQRLMLEGVQHLHQSGSARPRQQVTHIRFDPSNHALARSARFYLPELVQAVDFYCITNRCPRRMTFDQIDITRSPSRLLVGRPHGP